MTTFLAAGPPRGDTPKPILPGQRTLAELVTIRLFLVIPFAALAVAVPLTWGWGMTWVDLMLAGVFYTVSTLGVTVGFAPDLTGDRDIRVVDRLFPLWVTVTVLLPAVLGGVIALSWWGALTGFLWAGLARASFQHHVTWSVNSICHMIGDRPFRSRDRSANFWPRAILSMGESWHDSHHVDPISARLIWMFERFGWVWQVRWPTPQRLARLSNPRNTAVA